jgi:ABC-type lipoprotein release transport system permease subunit
VPPARADRVNRQIAALPQWETVGRGRPVVTSVRSGGRWLLTVPIAFQSGPFLTEFERPIVVEGRLPDPDRAEEVLVNEPFADALGLHAGDTFELRTVTPGGLPAASIGQLTRDPKGETLTMKVATVARRPADLDRETEAVAVTDVFGTSSWFIVLGPAFAERFEGRIATYGAAVQGRARPGQGEELAGAISDIGEPAVEVVQGNESEEAIAAVNRAVDFETRSLLLFAVVAAVTGVALVGQVLARQALLDLDGDLVLRSAGLRRPERAGVAVVRATVVALAGAAGAAALAIAASSQFPIGIAGRAELDPGVDVDLRVIGLGAALLVLAVVGWVAAVAWWATGERAGTAETRPPRRSSASTLAAGAGAPVTAVAGIRMAFERGRGRTAVPVVGAAIASTAGVVALSAVLVFSASLDHLVGTPDLQGWTWDATVGNLNDLEVVGEAEQALRANERVDAFVGFSSGPLVVDGHGTQAGALGRREGDAGPVAIDGRLPDANQEIALGRQTLADLNKKIGDSVQVAAAPNAPATEARIVGTLVLPTTLDEQLTLDEGALMTGDGLEAVYENPEGWIPNTFLVDFTDGTTTADGTASLRRDFPETVGTFRFAGDVRNLRRVQRLPRLLALLVGLLALGTLANVLVTSVRRHRRDLATFAALGFRRRQLGATVAWQATSFALVALVLGIPVGVAAGRSVWRLMMDSIGLEVGTSVPLTLLALVAIGAVVAANVVAFLPARSAARTHPAEILHTE